MAAVTVQTGSRRSNVTGSMRQITALVNTAATGDTFATGLKVIKYANADPPSTTTVAVNTSVSGGTLTFGYTGGGGITGIDVIAIGY